ncbi:hypothetical protein ON010_g8474 [Phytophthora cinnamomi]|nr:hypothetical protein ON010_g8474 [Phytophthora cinnamomi]
MEETVIFEKVKSNGASIKKRVPVFRDGTWKNWLEWLLRLSEYYVFVGYQSTEEDQFAFVEDLQALLVDDDLLMFNDAVAEEQLDHVDAAIHALRQLTLAHCPPGTRTIIIDELSNLRKTQAMSVREYSRAFKKLNRYITFIDDSEPIPQADCVRIYKNGMPIEWQIEVSRLSRSWDLAGLERQFELIERVEQEGEALRSRRRPPRDSNKDNASRSRGNSGGHQQQQQQGVNARPGRSPKCGQQHQEQGKSTNEDEMNALRFYQADEYNAKTFAEEGDSDKSANREEGPGLDASAANNERVCGGEKFGSATSTNCDERETLAPLLAKTRTATKPPTDEAINTGCSRSAIEQSVVEQVREQLVLRNGSAAAIPIILGKDFFSEQGTDLLFSSKELGWDGVRVTMTKPRASGSKSGLKPYREEGSCQVEIFVEENCGPVDYDLMIDARRLANDELLLVVAFLKEFDPVDLEILKESRMSYRCHMMQNHLRVDRIQYHTFTCGHQTRNSKARKAWRGVPGQLITIGVTSIYDTEDRRIYSAVVRLSEPQCAAATQIFPTVCHSRDITCLGLAVITQHDQPLAFWSKKCTELQRKYPANRLELLSILLLLREYRTMLLGQELHIHTDHLNLTYGTFNNIQMMHWRLEIEEFGPRLHYIKGKNNVVADALSRLPGPSCSELWKDEVAAQMDTANNEESVLFSLSLRQLAHAQANASNIGGVHKEINGVKLRVEPGSNCIIVPPHLQEPVMRAYHEWLMHPGGTAMYQTMKTSHWQKNMETHIMQYVRNCLACTKSKHPIVKYGKVPTKNVVVRPWFEVAIDSIGPYGRNKFRALTMIDTSTRLTEIQPVDDASSDDAAFVLDRFWLYRYPHPVRVIYDQGNSRKSSLSC